MKNLLKVLIVCACMLNSALVFAEWSCTARCDSFGFNSQYLTAYGPTRPQAWANLHMMCDNFHGAGSLEWFISAEDNCEKIQSRSETKQKNKKRLANDSIINEELEAKNSSGTTNTSVYITPMVKKSAKNSTSVK